MTLGLICCVLLQTIEVIGAETSGTAANNSQIDRFVSKIEDSDKKATLLYNQKTDENLANLLFDYGKKLYYGNETDIPGSNPKAFAFFKLAADRGSIEGHYYLALMAYFQIDGNYIMQMNSPKLRGDKYNYLLDYIRKSNITKTALHLYIASIQDHLPSSFVLSNFYSKVNLQ